MYDLLNAFVCAALLIGCFPVAVVMKSSGVWLARITLCVIAVTLGLQVLAPFFPWLPSASWLQACFNLLLGMAVLLARREIMAMVRARIGCRPNESHYFRRAEDAATAMRQCPPR